MISVGFPLYFLTSLHTQSKGPYNFCFTYEQIQTHTQRRRKCSRVKLTRLVTWTILETLPRGGEGCLVVRTGSSIVMDTPDFCWLMERRTRLSLGVTVRQRERGTGRYKAGEGKTITEWDKMEESSANEGNDWWKKRRWPREKIIKMVSYVYQEASGVEDWC